LIHFQLITMQAICRIGYT